MLPLWEIFSKMTAVITSLGNMGRGVESGSERASSAFQHTSADVELPLWEFREWC
jgi:hypothetical protein